MNAKIKAKFMVIYVAENDWETIQEEIWWAIERGKN